MISSFLRKSTKKKKHTTNDQIRPILQDNLCQISIISLPSFPYNILILLPLPMISATNQIMICRWDIGIFGQLQTSSAFAIRDNTDYAMRYEKARLSGFNQ